MRINKIGSFFATFAANEKFSDEKLKVLNGANRLIQWLQAIQGGFNHYYKEHLDTNVQWITYEFPESIKKIIVLFKTMRDLITPFPTPCAPDDPIVVLRKEAGLKLPNDNTFLHLADDSSEVKKIEMLLDHLAKDYEKELQFKDSLEGLKYSDGHFFQEKKFEGYETGRDGEDPGMYEWKTAHSVEVRVSDELEKRQKWVMAAKQAVHKLYLRINSNLV